MCGPNRSEGSLLPFLHWRLMWLETGGARPLPAKAPDAPAKAGKKGRKKAAKKAAGKGRKKTAG